MNHKAIPASTFFELSQKAILKAASAAKDVAIETGTSIVILKDKRLVRVTANELRSRKSTQQKLA